MVATYFEHGDLRDTYFVIQTHGHLQMHMTDVRHEQAYPLSRSSKGLSHTLKVHSTADNTAIHSNQVQIPYCYSTRFTFPASGVL
ncbi:hypothetical protein KIN20_018201 [Parelaphostrongylus tenuis]|uniref:Uncharacterized protein n=1 Tax=Parelaphostrongylus tenuis TaxID=148309 RepID=A0AAD5QRB1_PARTN|nr:hypothetical protein KIN20_018201 [Parelaphostrongylus tenuis]